MNIKHLKDLHHRGIFSEIDIHFARFITSLANDNDPDIFLGAALVSNVTGKGDVCLDLNLLSGKVLLEREKSLGPVVCPELAVWREKLSATRVVGRPGDYCPLILDEKNKLYLYRYWEYEKKISDSIKRRLSKGIRKVNLTILKGSIKKFFPESTSAAGDPHKEAALIATFTNFCVITGGPGTGKTFTVAKILALLLEQFEDQQLKIFLSAPTGKAAARLSESIKTARAKLDCSDVIKGAIPTEASTIHRMLKTIPGSPYFRYNSENPLPADVVVVDEASMVDLALMSKLMDAIPVEARLILIGDKDQLASVEAGSVLGDISAKFHSVGNRSSRRRFLENSCGRSEELTAENRNRFQQLNLYDCIVDFKKSYRFADSSGIGGFSRAVNVGDNGQALSLLKNTDKSINFNEIHSPRELSRALSEKIIEGYSHYLQTDDPSEALNRFNRFKILCAVNMGPFGVDAVNRLAEQVLTNVNLIQPDVSSDNPWYRGRPVLITSNDYNLELFNGDIGIVMPVPGTGSDDLYAFFPSAAGGLRRFLPHRLPEHGTVFAMTVHKSQGSEFDEVLLLLPDKDYPVLTRELLYTGVTRARHSVAIWGTETVLSRQISRRIERISGLRDALWE